MTLSYRSPTHANLLANYDRVYITRVPEAAAATEIANVLMTGALPAETPDATENIKTHAESIQGIGETVRERIIDIRDRALRISQAASVAETQQDVSAILELAQQMIEGVDANSNGQIEPIPGEGGILAAYQQAQSMADLPFAPGSADDGPPPKPATSDSTPTITISITDNAFSPSKLTIPLGATVVWKNEGPGEHTVTAEDGSFDSGALASGATFQHTFTKAEPFPYFCQFHGGKGGTGMGGSLLVSARSAAAVSQP
jgi:plastocyanin